MYKELEGRKFDARNVSTLYVDSIYLIIYILLMGVLVNNVNIVCINSYLKIMCLKSENACIP